MIYPVHSRRSANPRSVFHRVGAASMAALWFAGAAHAADAFPSRPITLVVPYASGGATDVIARAVAQGMASQLGKPVVIDNKPGAGGTIGATQVAHAPADGYAVLMGSPADQVNAQFLMAKPPYDAARDFEPVGCVTRGANVLVVNAKLPVQTVADLVRVAKAEPGKLNYGSSGNGTSSHLQGELLAQAAGIDIVHVPYRGSSPAITDLIGGNIQMLFSNPGTVTQHIAQGSLRAIAVTSSKRTAQLPNVPTFKESGLPIEVYSWACLMVPAKTPAPIVDRLHTALTAALADQVVVRAIEGAEAEPFPSSREEAKRFLADERSTWGNLIRTRKIQAD